MEIFFSGDVEGVSIFDIDRYCQSSFLAPTLQDLIHSLTIQERPHFLDGWQAALRFFASSHQPDKKYHGHNLRELSKILQLHEENYCFLHISCPDLVILVVWMFRGHTLKFLDDSALLRN